MSESYVKVARPFGKDGLGERWAKQEVAPTLNVFDNNGETRAVVLVVEQNKNVREVGK